MSTVRKPVKGESIFVPSSLYLGHGRDDFQGGVATVEDYFENKDLPEDHCNYMMVKIKERPNTKYNWKNLLGMIKAINLAAENVQKSLTHSIIPTGCGTYTLSYTDSLKMTSPCR